MRQCKTLWEVKVLQSILTIKNGGWNHHSWLGTLRSPQSFTLIDYIEAGGTIVCTLRWMMTISAFFKVNISVVFLAKAWLSDRFFKFLADLLDSTMKIWFHGQRNKFVVLCNFENIKIRSFLKVEIPSPNVREIYSQTHRINSSILCFKKLFLGIGAPYMKFVIQNRGPINLRRLLLSRRC